MDDGRFRAGSRRRARLPWAVYCAVSVLSLTGLGLTAQANGGRPLAALVLLGGLLAVGIAGVLVYAVVSPLPSPDGMGRAHATGGWDGGGSSGGGGGDFGGDGGCG